MPDSISPSFKTIDAINLEHDGNPSSSFTVISSYSDLLNLTRRQARVIADLEDALLETKRKLREVEEGREEAIGAAVQTARQEEKEKFEQESRTLIEAGLQSLSEGREAFTLFLKETESLTFQLLELALEPLFSKPEMMKATLEASVSQALEQIGASSVLNIRLNSDDFGDPADLMKIRDELALSNFSFEVDPTLRHGECVFELLLGEYEISLPRHWESLKDYLSDLSRERPT